MPLAWTSASERARTARSWLAPPCLRLYGQQRSTAAPTMAAAARKRALNSASENGKSNALS
eukprot:3091229-Lingulodinium_polyedra.AAC.1